MCRSFFPIGKKRVYIPLFSIVLETVTRFLPGRSSHGFAVAFLMKFSLNGYTDRSHVHRQSSSVLLTVSSASSSVSPSNLYAFDGLLVSHFPSVQSLLRFRMYCTACFAVQVVPPPIMAAVISPNRIWSPRHWITCSS